MNINLHIERLILDSLPLAVHDGPAIQAALETALGRLLATDGLPQITAGAWRNLSNGKIQLTGESRPAETGSQIAQAVHSALGSLGTAPRMVSGGARRGV